MEINTGGGKTPDFDLPDEILAVIPTDPYEQLDLARKITSMAICSRVSTLELEAGRLRQRLSEKDRVIGELQGEVSRLEGLAHDPEARLRAVMEENVRLREEKEVLETTVGKLTRDLTKLENFKTQLMRSLNEDNLPLPSESEDTWNHNHSVRSASFKYGEMTGHNSLGDSSGRTLQNVSSSNEQKLSLTPYITPRLTPTGTPKATSSLNSPRGFSTMGSPKMAPSVTSPTKTRTDGKIVFSPYYPSSQQSSAASSPPGSRGTGRTRIDGKEFFRQARNRLSYEQFGAFLANVKEFNAHKQSREETLKKTEEIFGTENRDLYVAFQAMLNRHLS